MRALTNTSSPQRYHHLRPKSYKADCFRQREINIENNALLEKLIVLRNVRSLARLTRLEQAQRKG